MIRLQYCIDGDDFLVMNGELVFKASDAPMACTSGIEILSDQLLESNETFILVLESSDQAISFENVSSQLTIEIRDTNSKWTTMSVYAYEL